MRQRERERKREAERLRLRERERDRETETERERERKREGANYIIGSKTSKNIFRTNIFGKRYATYSKINA